jgi:hypothetical protein
VVEPEGPRKSTAPLAAGDDVSSASLATDGAVTKLPVRSEFASSYTVENCCGPARCETGG